MLRGGNEAFPSRNGTYPSVKRLFQGLINLLATLALETANTNYNAANLTATALMAVRDNAVIVAENAAQDPANGAAGRGPYSGPISKRAT